MQQKETQRKADAHQFLEANGMPFTTHPQEHAKIDAVIFSDAGISFTSPDGETTTRAHENLQASDVGMSYTTDTKKKPADYTKAHVFK